MYGRIPLIFISCISSISFQIISWFVVMFDCIMINVTLQLKVFKFSTILTDFSYDESFADMTFVFGIRDNKVKRIIKDKFMWMMMKIINIKTLS